MNATGAFWRLQLNKVGNSIDGLYFYWYWPSFFIEGVYWLNESYWLILYDVNDENIQLLTGGRRVYTVYYYWNESFFKKKKSTDTLKEKMTLISASLWPERASSFKENRDASMFCVLVAHDCERAFQLSEK